MGNDQQGEDLSLELDANPSKSDIQVLDDGLEQFNQSLGRDRVKIPVAVWLRQRGRVLGGAYGNTHFGWLYLSTLWVHEQVRGEGWGGRLIRLFEAEGIARGCHGAWVDTYGFQAPTFYERVGYQEFGRLEEFPSGSVPPLLLEAPALTRTGAGGAPAPGVRGDLGMS